MNYTRFLKSALVKLLDEWYYAVLVVALIAGAGFAVMSMVAFLLASWMPLVVLFCIAGCLLTFCAFVFIVIITILWFQDKDALW